MHTVLGAFYCGIICSMWHIFEIKLAIQRAFVS